MSCHFKVEKEATQCPNKNCSSLNFAVELHYNLFISLSDHTGGVAGVRLQGQPACDLLKSTVSKLPGASCIYGHLYGVLEREGEYPTPIYPSVVLQT